MAGDLKHGRQVALKVLTAELSSAIDSERFRREIQIAARLNHPHILPVFDSGQAGNVLFYTMPFVAGESLRRRVDREQQLPIDDAIQISCEVADALEYAHSQGVVHRDIKPENVLLNAGHAVVADFGIARVLQEAGGQKLTSTGLSIGTASYMSPEQFSGENVDGRADLYSLACVLYEMLVGQVPFTGPNALAIMARHTMEQVPSVRIVRGTVPEEVEDALLRALEKVPADRFPSVAQFKQALLGTGTTNTYARRTRSYTATHRRISAIERAPGRWAVYGRRVLLAAAGLLVAGGGAFAFRLLSPRHRAASVAAGDVDPKRVGVMYFADETGTGALRYLADGLTESLIDRLAQVPALDVVSRNAVRPFRGRDVGADSVAHALGVGSVVRGAVAPTSKGVKVTVRLVDAAADVDVARRSFEVETKDIVLLQGQVASQVAEFLRERLGDEVRLREQKQATRSSEAWTLVQRAEKRRKDADSLAQAGASAAALDALAEAERALGRAAALDAAWVTVPVLRAAVAYAAAQALTREPRRLPLVVDSGLAHADRALALDPRSADALEQKGNLLFLRYTQHLVADPREAERTLVAAESTLTRAVDANRDQAGAWATLSAIYHRNTDLQRASIAALNAYRADSYLASAKTIVTRLFTTSYNLEQFPEAMRWCDEGRRRFPREPYFVHCRLMMYLTRYSPADPDSAWSYARAYAALAPEKNRELVARKGQIFVAGALVRARLADSARRVLARARGTPEIDPKRELEGYEPIVRVMLGEHEEAVRLLEDYLTVNPEHRKGFAARIHWWWRDIQSTPRFRSLIAGAR